MLATLARRLGFAATEQPARLIYLGGFFAAFAVIDRVTRSVAGIEADGIGDPVLLVSAIGSNRIAALVVLTVGLVLAKLRGASLWMPWSDLDQGATLRLLAAPLVALLTWQGVLYQYNYVADRAHLIDRGLLLVLAIGALARPALLLGFVIQTRVIAGQFSFPFGTQAAQNVDELLVLVLLAIAVAYLVGAVLDRDDSSPVIAVSAAAIATHFFIPGRGKVLLNWIVHEDLANLASSGYTVGWLGQTDGGFALRMADAVGTIGMPARLATLALELGVLIAVVHHRWFRAWLPMAFVFHVANFVLLGFSFLAWMTLEVVLFVILSRADLREWLDRSLSLGQAAMTAVAVAVLGPMLFHPPGLAWLDSPVAYGLEMEVEGESGQRYQLAFASFAPFDQDLAFGRVQLGETYPLTGAYGVVVSVERLDQLQALTAVGEVSAMELPVDEVDVARWARAQRFLVDFGHYANSRAAGEQRLAGLLAAVEPIPKYWTGRPAPNYDFQEPITSLTVYRVTSLRADDEFQRTRSEVFATTWEP